MLNHISGCHCRRWRLDRTAEVKSVLQAGQVGLELVVQNILGVKWPRPLVGNKCLLIELFVI